MNPVAGSLRDRRILVTGASRGSGIGFAVARACAQEGAAVFLHGLPSYDVEQGYPDGAVGLTSRLADSLIGEGLSAIALPDIDCSEPTAATRLFESVRGFGGDLDGLVLNHAHSVAAPLGSWTADHIDRHFAVNVRASMLLLQEFVSQLPANRTGSVVMMTSGQFLGPMVSEIAYAASKDAIVGLATQAAAALAPRVRVNCVNPGPTDTGYVTGEAWEAIRRRFPAGRWGTPDDTAKLVVFLLGDAAAWITGQRVTSEGGFRR
jgi:3-oxoacyl-[acyl-carrier protein] reductase